MSEIPTMRVSVIGCSGSFPGPESPASCYLVQAEHQGRTWSIALDLGNGSLGALQRHTDPLALDAVVLSHLHPDHFLDLCGLYVMQKYRPWRGPTRPIPVYGPADTPARVGLAYYGRPTETVQEFDFSPIETGSDVQIGPFRVQASLVNHPVEAYGYRVSAGDRVLAFTGDSDSCPALLELMTGADLVLADCAFIDGRDHDRDIHMTGSRAAQAALDAGGVGRLMLTHMPAWNDPEVCRAQAQSRWPGEIELARSGLVLDL